MSDETEITAIRGDTIEGTVSLKELIGCDNETQAAYAIPASPAIEMRFPGEGSTVSLTSGASEVTVTDAAKGELTFKMSPAKSALLKLGKKQTVTLHVTYNSGSDRKTFQKKSFLTVEDRAN